MFCSVEVYLMVSNGQYSTYLYSFTLADSQKNARQLQFLLACMKMVIKRKLASIDAAGQKESLSRCRNRCRSAQRKQSGISIKRFSSRIILGLFLIVYKIPLHISHILQEIHWLFLFTKQHFSVRLRFKYILPDKFKHSYGFLFGKGKCVSLYKAFGILKFHKF